MIFRQLFEPVSCTYTYLLGCPATGECALIDPVIETVERDLAVIRELGLRLAFTVETHIHADHLTGALKLKHLVGNQIAGPALDELPCTDMGLREGVPLMIGEIALHPLFTPGHTSTHHAYRVETNVQPLLFSGDALLIDGCGRTDFQSGDPVALYHSIHDQLFSLPDETLVYPGHNYEGRFVSSIAQEKTRNSRLGGGKSLEAFVAIMQNLNLTSPQKMAFAVPGNLLCGQCPPNVPDELHRLCIQG
ncbi:MAG: MBL fold metallo-hydrolase [Candidatus Competibacteraceae bacterium]|nr:MBL fold metallo-hydrolase [Candidatus Competibacteraceae bacterium]